MKERMGTETIKSHIESEKRRNKITLSVIHASLPHSSDVIKKYSSFISAPIEVNGEQANNIQPLWLMDPKEVSPEQHDEFYRFVGSAYDKPRFVLHYRTDAPIDLRCVLYVPEGKPGVQWWW